jgi:hypothetical protein
LNKSNHLTVRTITAAEHRAYIAARPSVPLEQTPGWARGFVTVRNESVGWFDDGRLIGAGLFRYRGLPRLPMRSVAVFDSGPDIDWTGNRRPRLALSDWLDPLIDHLRDRGVFSVRVNPVIAHQAWSGIDPKQTSDSSELVPHTKALPNPEYVECTERLTASRWRSMSTAGLRYSAEVSLQAKRRSRKATETSTSTDLIPGISLRLGTLEDLPQVQAAVKRAHTGINIPSSQDLESRWRGLGSDNIAGVQLVVAERKGDIVYGALLATVGAHAWDLSEPLPLPDADMPEVAVIRSQLMQVAADLDADWLFIPTISSNTKGSIPEPAPGWPPARLRELIGPWHYPVRATWHAALSPIVDRLVL